MKTRMLWSLGMMLAILPSVSASLLDAPLETPGLTVNHEPYLQLGDARQNTATDQIEIVWQTIPTGAPLEDTFQVEYRRAEDPDWSFAEPVRTLATNRDGRVNHFATIPGLPYGTNYEYRVHHLLGQTLVNQYQPNFRTRLAPSDSTPFTFVAYGDSAHRSGRFREVQSRINQLDQSHEVAFSLLLGDNVYPGFVDDSLDIRLDPERNPELAEYTASHVDYFAMGNHDPRQASEENYSVPSNGPPGETGFNYSFDYGNVHFATFDSTSISDYERLASQMEWLAADMASSDAEWKIVFTHFPLAGSPDKPETPGSNYYREVVPHLRESGVDLFVAGHSHTYHRSYPLLLADEVDGSRGEIEISGESYRYFTSNSATFLYDPDMDFPKGAGLTQLVVGTGGFSLRGGVFTQFPYDAAGFSTDTNPSSEFGFARIDVDGDRLTVSYVAADDGAVIDTFSISRPVPEPSTMSLLVLAFICAAACRKM